MLPKEDFYFNNKQVHDRDSHQPGDGDDKHVFGSLSMIHH
jgi:hypothetical protein